MYCYCTIYLNEFLFDIIYPTKSMVGRYDIIIGIQSNYIVVP